MTTRSKSPSPDSTPRFDSDVSEEQIRQERAKARLLRSSPWWKRKRSSGKCHYCGGDYPPGDLTMDHVVPIIRGGKASKGNSVPACKKCNSAKKYLLPWEWEGYLDRANR